MPNTPSGTRIWPTLMPLGRRFTLADLADRVGHGGDLLAAFGHGGDDLRRELQAVDHRRGQAGGARGVQVLRVGGLQRGRLVAQPRAPGRAARRSWPPWRPPPCVAAARAATPTWAM